MFKLDQRKPLGKTVKTTFIICGLETITQNASNTVFNISTTLENVETTKWLTYDLINAFSLGSSSDLYQVTDCPIKGYKMCEDEACATEISDEERFIINGTSL